MGRLEGKRAFITGAGSGVGNAMTRLFAAEGAKVCAVARRDDALRELSLIENVFAVRADVTQERDVDRAIDEAIEKLCGVDIVCNVAGITDMCHPLIETSEERWDAVIDTNLKGPFLVCRKAVPNMLSQGGGAILNIGSIAAFRGVHGPSYGAAKAGLVGMTLSIAVAYANAGVRCNLLSLGPVTGTSIATSSGGDMHSGGHAMALQILQARPVPLRCSPEDVAPAALFLCSDEAKHVNGATVTLDGGMSAC